MQLWLPDCQSNYDDLASIHSAEEQELAYQACADAVGDVPNDAAPNPLLVADFADLGDVNLDYARWRYGYNHETQSWHNTRDPTAPDSPTFGSAAAAAFGNGTRTITP